MHRTRWYLVMKLPGSLVRLGLMLKSLKLVIESVLGVSLIHVAIVSIVRQGKNNSVKKGLFQSLLGTTMMVILHMAAIHRQLLLRKIL